MLSWRAPVTFLPTKGWLRLALPRSLSMTNLLEPRLSAWNEGMLHYNTGAYVGHGSFVREDQSRVAHRCGARGWLPRVADRLPDHRAARCAEDRGATRQWHRDQVQRCACP